jgi:hypothetical protein
VVSYFLRYFSSTSTEQISPDSAGPFIVSIRLALLSGTRVYERRFKHDGFRVIARKTGKRVRLYSRPGNVLTYRFPLIVEAVARAFPGGIESGGFPSAFA